MGICIQRDWLEMQTFCMGKAEQGYSPHTAKCNSLVNSGKESISSASHGVVCQNKKMIHLLICEAVRE